MSPAEVKELRRALELTQAELARGLRVHWRTVHRWETGEGSEPTGLAKEVLQAIRQALDEGCDGARVGGLIALGIGGLIHYRLTEELRGK